MTLGRALLTLAMLWTVRVEAAGSHGGRARRVAICAGSDDGGPERQRLRFATSDAQGFCRVLNEIGGVASEDVFLLLNPSRAQLGAAFTQAAVIAKSPGPGVSSVELVFYFSGHSTDESLLLGSERITYPNFRKLFESVPTNVRIAVLDSCASGSFTRLKGGKPVAPFVMDALSNVRGEAVLTSSSATEASQESDRIHGSFFTHYLLSGLRGAADASHDGRVTLTEAYQFAFSETLARTQNTRGGAQHPSYEMELAGSGDVVMTDIREVSARIALAPDVEGRVFVRDLLQQLLLELYKPAGQTVELGVPAGEYTVTLDQKKEVLEAEVRVAAGERLRVPLARFRSVPRELTVLRGDAQPEAEMDDGFKRESPSLLAKGELLIGQTLHGVTQGILICEQLNCSSPRAAVGLALAGGALGASAVLYFGRNGVTPGTALGINAGSEWGLANGLLLNSALNLNQSTLSTIVGMGIGTGVGALVAAQTRPRAGDVSLVSSFGLWGGTLTALTLAGISNGGTHFALFTGLVLTATDAGLLAGSFLSSRWMVSRGHLLLIDSGGLLGGLLGTGVTVVINSRVSTRELALGAAAGAGVGLVTAILLSRNLDAPKAPPLTLVPTYDHHAPGAALSMAW